MFLYSLPTSLEVQLNWVEVLFQLLQDSPPANLKTRFKVCNYFMPIKVWLYKSAERVQLEVSSDAIPSNLELPTG